MFNDTVSEGCIGLEGDRIAYVGPLEPPYEAAEILDGGGCYALPGFVDSHMHLESSMLTPAHFARAALCCGTTTVAADPHEDRKSTRLNSSHITRSRMPSSA